MPSSAQSPPDPPSPKRRDKSSLLSVITVFWNAADDLDRYFHAMEETRKRLKSRVEVIAVDNASADGTADAIASRYPQTHLIRNETNRGFAPACNQGLESARGDYLLLLNPDCEANAGALNGMVRFLERHPDAGAVGCALLHSDGLRQHSYHHDPSWWSYWGTHSFISPLTLRIHKALHQKRGRSPRPFKVDWLMGACLMVRRDVYRAVGGMDGDYFMYSEDTDWCRRIRNAGYAVIHHPGLTMTHHHGTSARKRPEFAFRRLYRSLLMFSRKLMSPWSAFALRLAVVLDMVARLPIYSLTRQSGRLESVRRVLSMYLSNDPERFPEEPPR